MQFTCNIQYVAGEQCTLRVHHLRRGSSLGSNYDIASYTLLSSSTNLLKNSSATRM